MEILALIERGVCGYQVNRIVKPAKELKIIAMEECAVGEVHFFLQFTRLIHFTFTGFLIGGELPCSLYI